MACAVRTATSVARATCRARLSRSGTRRSSSWTWPGNSSPARPSSSPSATTTDSRHSRKTFSANSASTWPVGSARGCTFSSAAVGIGFQSPYLPRTHRKTCGNPHGIYIPTVPRNSPPCVFSLDAFLNKHIYAVHVTVLLCVFSNDNEEKLPVKQITNWTVFGEIQTATTTFLVCLTRFRVISHPFENLHRIPTGLWGFNHRPSR